MATLTKGKTFGATEQVTNAKLHQLVDSATITGIVGSEINSAYRLVDCSATAPASPSANDVWLDTTNYVLKRYDGTNWIQCSRRIATSAPSSPQEGDLWYDTTNNILKSYDGSAWSAVGTTTTSNLIPNGSFESWSDGISNQAPDGGWAMIGTPTDVSRDTGERDNFGNPYAVKVTSAGSSNEGISYTLTKLRASTTYYVRIRAKATSGDTAKIWTTGATTNLSETTTLTTWTTLSGSFITDATPTNVVLRLGSDTATDVVYFDALIAVEGAAPAAYSPQLSETIFFDEPITSTSWDGDARSDESWTDLNIPTVFSGAPVAKAYLLYVAVQDSEATPNNYIAFRKNGSTAESARCQQHSGADNIMYHQVWVWGDSSGVIEYKVDASGALTCDVTIEVVGAIL